MLRPTPTRSSWKTPRSNPSSSLISRARWPAYLTGFRSEGGEAQVSAGCVANRATQSKLRYVEEHDLRQARRDAAIRRP
jgi:hypothetical protein